MSMTRRAMSEEDAVSFGSTQFPSWLIPCCGGSRGCIYIYIPESYASRSYSLCWEYPVSLLVDSMLCVFVCVCVCVRVCVCACVSTFQRAMLAEAMVLMLKLKVLCHKVHSNRLLYTNSCMIHCGVTLTETWITTVNRVGPQGAL